VLIYNYKKELVGIDDETLHHLGYATLASFLDEHSDVAELFVKKPGFIHNFQNFPWIDFVLHADAEDTKAIIENGDKHFSCSIDITPIFLTDAPDQEGYIVHLKHIRSLRGGEMPEFTRETSTVSAPGTPSEPQAPAAPEQPSMLQLDEEEIVTPAPSMTQTEPTVLSEPDILDIPDIPDIELPELNPDGSIAELDVFADTPNIPDQPTAPSAAASAPSAERPMLGDYINKEEASFLENLKTPSDYQYDPHVAADELGLPVELIEEFIGDFIQQAHEFQKDLFDATLKEDFDEVHVLSHKLKGVAANLRIEDAFEVLSIINGSHDAVEIEANLKQFYRIIAKMEGKEVPDFAELEPQGSLQTALDDHEDDDIYDIGLLLGDQKPTAKAPHPGAGEPPAEEPSGTVSSDKEVLPTTEEEPAPLSTFDDDEELVMFESEEELPTLEETRNFEEEFLPIVEEKNASESPLPKAHEEESQPPAKVEPAPPLEAGSKEEHAAAAEAETLRYDRHKAALELGIKEAFVHDLVSEFRNDAAAKRDTLLTAAKQGDFRTLKAFAFEFKGLADNLRIVQLSDSLAQLLHQDDSAAAQTELKRFFELLEQL